MTLSDYVGRFHPALVHFPVALLLTGILFEWLSRRKGFRKLRKSVRLLLLLGFISALLASITGYLHSLSDGFDTDQTRFHQWLGISVTILAFVSLLIMKRKESEFRLAYNFILFSLAILVVLTGHAGAGITYGTNYLKPPALSELFGTKSEHWQQADLDSAFLYKDLIEPILEEKCYACHGSSRQKGKLRLDGPDYIEKGGKDGSLFKSDPREGELFQRIHLPKVDEDHMPPKEKKQLSASEIQLISFWISHGHDFSSKLSAMPQGDSLIGLLKTRKGDDFMSEERTLPKISAPDPAVIDDLKSHGVSVSFLEQGNGALSLNFISVDTSGLESFAGELARIVPQLVELKMSGCRMPAGKWSFLSGLTSLERLHLDHTNISDADLSFVAAIHSLEYLNLTGTHITKDGLQSLGEMKSLRKLYLFDTGVGIADESSMSIMFPHAQVDFGNYVVPIFPSDTTVLTKPYVVPK